MGKEGPCYHCGITTTPLWRNGPPEKPILCNACGSRWRTKGTLLNYMPMHSGGFGAENSRWPMKNSTRLSSSPARKRKKESPSSESGLSKTSNTYVSSSVDEEDASTLGSELSTFDGGAHSVPVRGTPWETPVPSRRRTSMFRSRVPSERMSRKLVSVEEQEVSSVTCPSSEVFLESTRSPLVAVEAGLGSVFIRPPATSTREPEAEPEAELEPESEATSLLIDNTSRVFELGNTGLYSSRLGASAVPSRGKEIRPGLRRPEAGRGFSNKSFLENFPYSKRDVLQSVKSPLVFLELKDVVNYDTFAGLLTEQEQRQLMKHLSSVDVSQCPESLRSMFTSLQFRGALDNFQQLLAGGMFDSSGAGFNARLVQHYQQLLSVTDLTGSGWMESLSQFQTRSSCKQRRPEASLKLKPDHLEGASPLLPAETTKNSTPAGTHQAQDSPAQKTGSSSARDEEDWGSRVKKKPVNLMEEGHDSGGEQDDLLVDVPSLNHRADSLLLLNNNNNNSLRPSSACWTMTNDSTRGNNPTTTQAAEAGDLIITNTWQTADWDVGLIGAARRRDFLSVNP